MVCRYFILFIILSFMGWIYEEFFCVIKTGKWENRGFLFGPICPIYGVGAIVTWCVYSEYYYLFFYFNNYIFIFLISSVGSFFIEYITSYLFEKIFHAIWWDYKDLPLNIKGRVCIPFTICFGLAGIFFIKFVFPILFSFIFMFPLQIIELFSLIFMGLFAIDITLTICTLTEFLEKIENAESIFNNKMDLFVSNMVLSQKSALMRVKEFKIPRIGKKRIESIIKKIKRNKK